MFSFFKPAEPDPKPLAKELFEKVTAMKSESHEVRNARSRIEVNRLIDACAWAC